ncbi:MAG: DUF47 family protein [Clostridiales bacterium]|nr:DUF47 family protein [Clostridiales bacterium]
MANKADRFYFENFIEAADCACKGANYLVECLSDYNPEKIREMLDTMHAFEHEGDGKKHEMSAALARAFVTPIDREDLADISQNIDEVSDCLEEVLQRFYVDQIQTIPEEAVIFAKKLVDSCELMKKMLAEFVNFKKPAKLHDMIVEMNHVEEECDRLYLEATLNVRSQFTDALDVIAWREIYDRMERCSDACEHVGDCVETVVMKNT